MPLVNYGFRRLTLVSQCSPLPLLRDTPLRHNRIAHRCSNQRRIRAYRPIHPPRQSISPRPMLSVMLKATSEKRTWPLRTRASAARRRRSRSMLIRPWRFALPTTSYPMPTSKGCSLLLPRILFSGLRSTSARGRHTVMNSCSISADFATTSVARLRALATP